ncbi:MAG: GNAT family N-acetyltransferase [candidate division WOR-3 bacterium]
MTELKQIEGTGDLTDAFQIRHEVFIQEQKVAPELEWDEWDKIATHFVLYQDKVPIGTARVFEKDGIWYVGRMAIRKEYRGKGYGKFLMDNIMRYLKSKKPTKIVINAQTSVLSFYRKFGFMEIGDEFLEAGIKHKEMVYLPR